jgi:hypothetical protein
MARKARPNKTSLARPGDPLVTERGIAIAPDRDADADVVIPDDKQINAKAFKPRRQRSAKELPAAPQMMKAVACVFLLTTLGLTERETANVLGIDLGDVKAVKTSPTYTECFNEVLQELINANSEMLSARLASYATGAVDNIAHLARNGKKEEVQLRASQDIADRAGIGVQKGINIGITGGELRIQYIDADKTADIKLQQ